MGKVTFRKSFDRSSCRLFLTPTLHCRDSQITDQLKVVNDDFNQTSLSFEVQNITRITNEEWFNITSGSTQETDMKTSLRNLGPLERTDASTLSIYTVGHVVSDGDSVLGYATFPDEHEANPALDGIVLLYTTLPGGSEAPFNQGRTLTHLIGHWVGLYHTFQGGCNGDGDFVDNTPAEASATYGCPTNNPDTCSGEGLDRESTFRSSPSGFVTYSLSFLAIHNYMDYTDDSCMDNFTSSQIGRLLSRISAYRGIDV